MNYSNSQRAGVILNFTALLFGAYVFMIKGDSYRGRKLETLGLEAGIAKHTEYKNA